MRLQRLFRKEQLWKQDKETMIGFPCQRSQFPEGKEPDYCIYRKFGFKELLWKRESSCGTMAAYKGRTENFPGRKGSRIFQECQKSQPDFTGIRGGTYDEQSNFH